MTLAWIALLGLPLLLAWANGANDISKGIATLVGSGVLSFRAAVLWGTVWTVAGGLVAAFASQGLVATFSGKGFLASPIGGSGFPAAVAIGAAAWVLFASFTGLPVSTTHAITGALAGAGIVAQGMTALHWDFLGKKVALPLGLSPLLSVSLLYVAFPVLRRALARTDVYCLCLERRARILQPASGLAFVPAPAGAGSGSDAEIPAQSLLSASPPSLVSISAGPIIGTSEECAASPMIAGRLAVSDGLHWSSAAMTSFARGLNDTPKIVALGIVAAAALDMTGLPFYVLVATAIGAGSLVAGFRVTETLARKVTSMSPVEGVAANVVTTLLVGLASWQALPVSTTHVSSGAIIGIGLHRGARSVHWRIVGGMLLAWLVTLPAAALAGAAAYAILR